jgi:hypothetical protein
MIYRSAFVSWQIWNRHGTRRSTGRIFAECALRMAACCPIIYVSLKDPDKVMAVLTEAKGGAAFLGSLCDRGLFPEAVWRKALGDTSGGMHCWPPASSDA